MVTISLYGGVSEIGGNRILIEDRETRVFLDFGQRMGFESDFFANFLQPRTNTALQDRLAIGALPKINGIYRRDLLRPIGVEKLSNSRYSRIIQLDSPFLTNFPIKTYEEYLDENEKPFVDAILLTHAHLDHTGSIRFLHQDIPIYCSPITKTLVEAIDKVSSFPSQALEIKTNEIRFTNNRSRIPDSPKIIHTSIPRPCILMEENKTRQIGSISARIIFQDHSISGAGSFIIETDETKLLYTGDIRFHGYYPMTIKQYVKKTGGKIDVMICEGTRIDSDTILTEEHVQKKITDEIKKIKGLVFIDFNWKDTTRYETIRRAAEKAGRTFIISSRLAYLLKKLNIDLGETKVFLKRKGSCLYSPGDYNKTLYDLGFSADWQSEKEDWTHYENGLTAEDIKSNPSKYVMMLPYYDLNQLFDLSDDNGRLPDAWFIKAQCAPFSDEMEIDEERLIHWLKTFNIGYNLAEIIPPPGCSNPNCEKLKKQIERSHVSGHASKAELEELIRLIEPSILIPVHTDYPEKFYDITEDLGVEIILPEYGKTYTF